MLEGFVVRGPLARQSVVLGLSNQLDYSRSFRARKNKPGVYLISGCGILRIRFPVMARTCWKVQFHTYVQSSWCTFQPLTLFSF